MLIPDGYHSLAPGKIASVVTYVQMTARPQWIDDEFPGQLTPANVTNLAAYRALFRKIGEHWLWFSRLRANDAELRDKITNPAYKVYEFNGGAGLVELEFEASGDVEIKLFGLAPGETGRGTGRAMMAHTLHEAWRAGTGRVWLHTCTLDDPRALGFYRKMGFRPYARGIEIATDPRIDGHLPESAAPQVPLIR